MTSVRSCPADRAHTRLTASREGLARRAVAAAMASIALVLWMALWSAAPAASAAQIENLKMTGGSTSASVTATLDPEGESTECKLQYVTEAGYEAAGFRGATEAACSPSSVPSSTHAETVVVQLQGLVVNTAYRARFVLVGRPGGATSYVGEQSFATFGVAQLGLSLLDEEEKPYLQAGGHPFELVDDITLDTVPYLGIRGPDGQPKDIVMKLPEGLVGDPTAVPQCARYAEERFECSPASQVGVIVITLAEKAGNEVTQQEVFTEPIFNLVPPKGVAAQFGTRVSDIAGAYIDASVRTGEGYGVNAASLNITSLANVLAASVQMWGVPGSPAHDSERYCLPTPEKSGIGYMKPPCAEGSLPLPEVPFLRNPTSCDGPLVSTAIVDSYQHPGEEIEKTVKTASGMIGCGKLSFSPTLAVTPTSSSSDSPTGAEVVLHVPQNEATLAEPDLKDATVTMPPGLTVNPAAAGGMEACPLLHGNEAHPEEPGIDLENAEPAHCPAAAKIGMVDLETPLFPHKVFEGAVYVARQQANPFGSLLAIYVAIDEPDTGVVVKLAGRVQLNEQTGQLTTSFDENPQLPFENLRLTFFKGQRAALATPRSCGTYQATSVLEPWSHQAAEGEAEGTPDAQPSAQFQIVSGPGGAACAVAGFNPAFVAGTTSNQAAGFGTFSMRVSRNDGEQRLSTVSMRMPKGVAAILANVPLCGQAQANAGTCPAASKIGHVTGTGGVGADPVSLPQVGRPEDPVYLTGPYDGAPFGLSIVVPAQAGPFDLGTIVDRAKINVDPHTAQVVVESQAIPTLLRGVPLDVRSIDVTIDRPRFMFNPTNCEPMSVNGDVASAEGATAAVSARFQAAGCRSLPFNPGFNVFSHRGHTRRFGAYLRVQVTSGRGQANIKSVHVTLPKILPARDETLNHACAAAQFEANPAGCPADSYVGTAYAETPVLPVPLSGPAIFVSHGGAAFPDIDVVLQGDGVTVDLTGTTSIDKQITSSDFRSVPDVPVRRFELTLQEGPNSALAATGNLCRRLTTRYVEVSVHGHLVRRARHYTRRRRLIMPTTITGQNGAQITRKIVIAVEHCQKIKHKKRRNRR